jgi:hypothetical protein
MTILATLERDWHDLALRGPSEGWHNNPRADFLREALVEIAESKSLTATSTQFAAYLQRLACKVLTADARAEPDDITERQMQEQEQPE